MKMIDVQDICGATHALMNCIKLYLFQDCIPAMSINEKSLIPKNICTRLTASQPTTKLANVIGMPQVDGL